MIIPLYDICYNTYACCLFEYSNFYEFLFSFFFVYVAVLCILSFSQLLLVFLKKKKSIDMSFSGRICALLFSL